MAEPLDSLQILLPSDQSAENIINNIKAIEAGRRIARDIGGSDPERMAPLKCAEYLVEAFKDSTNVKLTVISDPAVLLKEYPLLHAGKLLSFIDGRYGVISRCSSM